MNKEPSPLELAALATVAVPKLCVTALREPQFDDQYASSTVIVDADGNSWRVTASKVPTTRSRMVAQLKLVEILGALDDAGKLPFIVPRIAGVVPTSENTFATVENFPGGNILQESSLATSSLFASSLGRSLAALHSVSTDSLSALELPTVTPDEIRDQWRERLQGVGRQVPGDLRKRWDVALREDALWTFNPTLIHGDLALADIAVNEGTVWALSGFDSARIADPASDISWLLPLASLEFMENLFIAYVAGRSEPDLHLLKRAQLYSELALVDWLQYGEKLEDEQIIAEAEQMIADLNADLAGEMLVNSTRPVSEIHFTIEEEPLNRIWRRDTQDTDVPTADQDQVTEVIAPMDLSPSAPASAPDERSRPLSDPIPILAESTHADVISAPIPIVELSDDPADEDSIATEVFAHLGDLGDPQ